ncbi:MAG: hypothetical protein H5T47_05150 [Archaeoglobi archaeon]|nr:hypothetical protein [Candidatus Mnemosynella bozhongmuii]
MPRDLILEYRGKKIPVLSLGTSPFIGAAQFGLRALRYRNFWFNHPERMERAFLMAYDLGVPGVHLLPYEPILDAAERALKKADLIVTATVELGNEEILRRLREIGASAIAIHAEWSDRRHPGIFRELERISEFALCGLATHRPDVTLELTKDFANDFYMVPVNPLGKYMGNVERALNSYLSTEKILVGMKVLAAGKVPVRDALEFAMKYVDAVTIGIGSFGEIEDTFSAAISVLREIQSL